MSLSFSRSQYTGTVRPEGERQSNESHENLDDKSLAEQSKTVTEGLIKLQGENKTLKDEVRQLKQSSYEFTQR